SRQYATRGPNSRTNAMGPFVSIPRPQAAPETIHHFQWNVFPEIASRAANIDVVTNSVSKLSRMRNRPHAAYPMFNASANDPQNAARRPISRLPNANVITIDKNVAVAGTRRATQSNGPNNL